MVPPVLAAQDAFGIAYKKSDLSPYRVYGYFNHDDETQYWEVQSQTSFVVISEDLNVLSAEPDILDSLNLDEYQSMLNYGREYISYRVKFDDIFSPKDGREVLQRFYNSRHLWDQRFYDTYEETLRIKKCAAEVYPQFGYVYMLRDLAGNFKIGMTEDPERRLRQHSRNIVNFDVSAAHVFPCANRHQAESAIHRWYEVQMVASETFLLNEAQEQAIRSIEYCDDTRQMLDTLPLPTEELRAQAKELRNK